MVGAIPVNPVGGEPGSDAAEIFDSMARRSMMGTAQSSPNFRALMVW